VTERVRILGTLMLKIWRTSPRLAFVTLVLLLAGSLSGPFVALARYRSSSSNASRVAEALLGSSFKTARQYRTSAASGEYGKRCAKSVSTRSAVRSRDSRASAIARACAAGHSVLAETTGRDGRAGWLDRQPTAPTSPTIASHVRAAGLTTRPRAR
jgi:hypothetical protein